MENKLVSIITPAYKTEKYIAETIESVLAQTYSNWELLIADDCSPDNTATIVQAYASKDSRIKYLKMPNNGGPANARNLSLENAKGKYIAFLDSDDLWEPQKLELQIKFMNENQIAFSYTNYIRMHIDGTLYTFYNKCPSQMTYKEILKNTTISTLTVMLDKERITNIKMTPGWGYDDFVLWLNITKKGTTAYGLNRCLARYRIMNNSVSSNKTRALKWVWNIYRDHEGFNIFLSIYYILNFSINAFIKRFKGQNIDNELNG